MNIVQYDDQYHIYPISLIVILHYKTNGMKYIRVVMLMLSFVSMSLIASAQNFKKDQQKQERIIKAAYKQKKITTVEYEKLMKEQYSIKQTIEKYEKDGVMTSKEKNNLNRDLKNAEERLGKYKTNAEQY
jgi:hypothetical protein